MKTPQETKKKTTPKKRKVVNTAQETKEQLHERLDTELNDALWRTPISAPNIKQPDGVRYTFNTTHGKMWVSPGDIMHALEEQSNLENEELLPPEEDLQGWALIHGTDELGATRPLLLMRMLPVGGPPKPYTEFRGDDIAMQDIILKGIYKLTPMKIRWLRFKKRIKNIFRRKSKNDKIKKPHSTEGWLGDMMNEHLEDHR